MTHSSSFHQENSNASYTQDGLADDCNTSMTSDDGRPSSPTSSSITRGPKVISAAAIAAHNADILAKISDMSSSSSSPLPPEQLAARRDFVSRLGKIWEDYAIQCRSLPNISKQPLDLYRLYVMVREKGGFNEVTKAKLWKDISAALNIQASASAAFNVRKKYVSLGIFHYECKFDLNGTDPLPIIAEMEKTAQAQKKPPKSANNSVNEAALNLTGSPGMRIITFYYYYY